MTSFTVILSIGAVGMLTYAIIQRKKYSLNVLQVALVTILLTLVGVAGAKLMFATENGFQAWGGISFFGSVFLIPVMMPLLGLLFRLKFSQTLDLCAPCVAIMITCLRVNCMISGCCGGWQVCIGEVCFTWPTQAIESVMDLIIFLLLLKLGTDNTHNGRLYPTFMISYGSIRFLLEFLRDTPKEWLFMSHGQWFSLIAIVIGIAWLVLGKRIDNRGISQHSSK